MPALIPVIPTVLHSSQVTLTVVGIILTISTIADTETTQDPFHCADNVRVLDTLLYPELLPLSELTDPNTYRVYLALMSEFSDPIDGYHHMTAREIVTEFGSIPYEYVASSINLAYEDFCARGGLTNITVEIVYMDDGCNPKQGVTNLIDIERVGVDVVIGMPCSIVTVPAGYYLSYWNTPLITYASTDAVVTDKSVYDTVIRMGEGYKEIGHAFVEIFNEFGWTKAAIMTKTTGLCHYGNTYIPNHFREAGLEITDMEELEGSLTDASAEIFLHYMQERARIFIICLDEEDLITLMLTAQRLDMVNPEYVYFTFALLPDATVFEPWGSLDHLSNQDVISRKAAFTFVKYVTTEDITREELSKNTLIRIAETMDEPPWNIRFVDRDGFGELPFGLYLYDSMWFYLMAVNESLHEGLNPRDGRLMFEKARNRIFEGVSGHVDIDDEADRSPNYWLWHYHGTEARFQHFADVQMLSHLPIEIIYYEEAYWGTEGNIPPPDVPLCGFRGDECPPDHSLRNGLLIGTSIFIIVLGAVSTVVIIIYRRKKLEEEIQKMSWMLDYEELDFTSSHSHQSLVTLPSSFGSRWDNSHSDDVSTKSHRHIMANNNVSSSSYSNRLARFRGQLHVVKKIEKDNVQLTRHDLVELKTIKDMQHDNLVGFVGACIVPPNICIVTQYCPKGSLQDILQHDEIKLDWTFKSSFISDLVNPHQTTFYKLLAQELGDLCSPNMGMIYIQGSPLESHGRLRSSCCFVDSRWVLKITDFGLHNIKAGDKRKEELGEYEILKGELWTAPELLRMSPLKRPVQGTQKADIYSFSIIFHEILFRALPFFVDESSPKDVVYKVKRQGKTPYRPEMRALDQDTDRKVLDLITECWEEDPKYRPDFHFVKKRLTQLNRGKKVNILDTMLNKLEQYANNLESIVEKRTSELSAEKKKTDVLLYRMLPETVADKLKIGQGVAPEVYESVTVFFSDVVGFTELSSLSTPMEIVDFLNDLYTMFDDIIMTFDVYKVETIGDAYMVASGLPQRNGDNHSAEIANLSIKITDSCSKFRIRHVPDRPLYIRIGVHTGPCAAGVVGLTMPRYCLFGDTVNMASRMESNGQAMKIHLSETAYLALRSKNMYRFSKRGTIEVKGKGTLTTYWLEGKLELLS